MENSRKYFSVFFEKLEVAIFDDKIKLRRLIRRKIYRYQIDVTKIHMNWNNALRDFEHYLKIERGLSEHTVSSYRLDVKKLILYWTTFSWNETLISKEFFLYSYFSS